MAGYKRASRRVVIGDDYVEAITHPFRASVSLFEGGDIKVRGGKIVEKNLRWGATLKGSKGFCVAKAALAGVDHRV
jgi:hypothetical protein